ncbi:hypothetical protein SynMVIR181_02602 [Synechococcus sp. MVIR-18-1]|nr:hypothetical protein SynMVIR181_02602 [Synechococcus sp. MVIR-18-1]
MAKSSDSSSFFVGEAVFGLASINCLRNASISMLALLLFSFFSIRLNSSMFVAFNTEMLIVRHQSSDSLALFMV